MKEILIKSRSKKKIIFFLFFVLIFITISPYIFTLYKQNSAQNYFEGIRKIKINDDDTIVEKFYTGLDQIDKIYIPILTEKKEKYKNIDEEIFSEKKMLNKDIYAFDYNKSYFEIQIYDTSNNLLYSKLKNADYISNDGKLKISSLNFKKVRWTSLFLKITFHENKNDHYIYRLNFGSRNTSISTNYNNQNIENSLCINVDGTNKDYSNIWVIYVIYTIIILLILKLYRLKVNSNFKAFDKKTLFYPLYFFVSLFLCYSLFNVVVNVYFYYQLPLIYFIISLICLAIIVFSLYFNLIINKEKIEKIFLLIMIPIGLLYLTFMIPNWVSDEDAHYYKAYTVSQLKVKPTIYNEVPTVVVQKDVNSVKDYKTLSEEIAVKTNYKSTTSIIGLANAYNFLLYVPSAFGIGISRILNLNIFIGYYIGRIMNFICFLFLGYFSLKKIPYCKNILFIYLFNPMLIHQAISLSADSLINSICIFFISYTLYLSSIKSINNHQKLILFISMISLATMKYVYVPLVLITLSLFKKCESKKEKYRLIISSLIVFLFTLILFKYTNSIIIQSNDVSSINNDIDLGYGNTIISVIKNPLHYANILFNSIIYRGTFYVESFFGTQLGWFSIDNFRIMIYIYIYWLFYNSIKFNDSVLQKSEKILFSLILFAMINIIFFAFYLSYADYSQYTIHGIQGRYFIPFMLLFFLLIKKKNPNNSIENQNKIFNRTIKIITIVNIFSILSIIQSFI